MSHDSTPKRLKPAGHSALMEAMIQPAIAIASTLMSIIAAYVLASDEINHLINGHGTPADALVVGLCAGMGLLIDTAIIISATRYQMHMIRNDPREKRWKTYAQWVLIISLGTETMTTFYFFTQLTPRDFPWWLLAVASAIHAVLSVARAFMTPLILAFFSAGILPVMFDRSDLNREILARTSSNIALIVDRLSIVFDTEDKGELLRALAGQLMLNTYAKYDDTAHMTEESQRRRDGQLITHFGRIHRLDWSAIAADVAPELVTPRGASVITVTAMPEPPETTPPDGPRGGGLRVGLSDDPQGGTNDLVYAPPVPMVSRRADGTQRTSARVGLNSVAQGGTNGGTKRARVGGTKNASTGGTSHATKRRVVRRRLTVGERNTLDHATAEEVRQKIAAGEHWTQTRIKSEYGVSNLRARDIWYEVQHGQPRLRAVGMR